MKNKSTSFMVRLGNKIKLMLSLSLVNEKKMNYVLISSVKITSSKKTKQEIVIVVFLCITVFFKLKIFLF